MDLMSLMRWTMGAVLLATSGTPDAATAEPPNVGIGDVPPAIAPMAWIKSQGDDVPLAKSGKVRVVNFFATWCGASRQSMAMMTRLARKYPNDLEIVGISVRETERGAGTVEAVSRFVEENPERFDYAVAMDDPVTKPLFTAWMRGAGMYVIPTAFIIGRDGHIAWIGFPIDAAASYPFEKAIDDAIVGNIDRAAADVLHRQAESEVQRYLMDKEVMADVDDALEAKDYARALIAMDYAVANHPEYRQRILYSRIEALLQLEEARALEFIETELVFVAANDPENLEIIAGGIGQTMGEYPGLSPIGRKSAVGFCSADCLWSQTHTGAC